MKSLSKILFLVPHPDDEVNIGYNLIPFFIQQGCSVTVAFTTCGDNRLPAGTRIQEAINSLRIAGVPKKNIWFLGYPDSGEDFRQHYFFATEALSPQKRNISDAIKAGANVLGHSTDFCTHDSLVEDIYKLISILAPTAIFAVGMDSHPDHQALFLGLESSLEKMRRLGAEVPDVYIKYAYAHAYLAKRDFLDPTLRETSQGSYIPLGLRYDTSWENRLRVQVIPQNLHPLVSRNLAYKMMRCHVSQLSLINVLGIINADDVFWPRNTNQGNFLFDYCEQREIDGEEGFQNLFTSLLSRLCILVGTAIGYVVVVIRYIKRQGIKNALKRIVRM